MTLNASWHPFNKRNAQTNSRLNISSYAIYNGNCIFVIFDFHRFFSSGFAVQFLLYINMKNLIEVKIIGGHKWADAKASSLHQSIFKSKANGEIKTIQPKKNQRENLFEWTVNIIDAVRRWTESVRFQI